MKFKSFNLGKGVIEEKEQTIYVDFQLYRYLFINMLKNSDIPEHILLEMLYLYDNALKIKKKRIRHKKLKQLFPYMELLMEKSETKEENEKVAM